MSVMKSAGVGDLVTIPVGAGGLLTLSFGSYQVFGDFEGKKLWGDGLSRAAEHGAHGIVSGLQMLALFLVKAAVSAQMWMLKLSDEVEVVDQAAKFVTANNAAIGGAVLAPALILGCLGIAIGSKRGDDWIASTLGLAAIAGVASAFMLHGGEIVRTADKARTASTELAASKIVGDVAQTDVPFKFPAPKTAGSKSDKMVAQYGEILWRNYAVVPWCVTQFGSLDVCKKHGGAWMKLTSNDARKQYAEAHIFPDLGKDSDAANYIRGRDPGGRLASALVALVIAICALVFSLAAPATVLMSLLMAVLLSCLMTLWLSMCLVPGPLRRFGSGLVDTVIGLWIMSCIATALLLATVVMTGSALLVVAPLGPMAMMVAGIAIMVAGGAAMSTVQRHFTGGAGGVSGSRVLGAVMAARSLGRMTTKGISGAVKGAQSMGRAGKAAGGKVGSAGKAVGGAVGRAGKAAGGALGRAGSSAGRRVGAWAGARQKAWAGRRGSGTSAGRRRFRPRPYVGRRRGAGAGGRRRGAGAGGRRR